MLQNLKLALTLQESTLYIDYNDHQKYAGRNFLVANRINKEFKEKILKSINVNYNKSLQEVQEIPHQSFR